jgi:hypothetical protein
VNRRPRSGRVHQANGRVPVARRATLISTGPDAVTTGRVPQTAFHAVLLGLNSASAHPIDPGLTRIGTYFSPKRRRCPCSA